MSVSADTRAWGLDANARFDTYRLYSDRTELLVGVRYANLSENLTYAVRSDFVGGGVITVRDAFRARNDLYVGQAGFESRWRLGRFTFDLLDKFGVGGASQRIEIFGRNTLTGLPDQDSGLYTQPGISGVYQRDKFVATNEFGVALGFSPVPRVSFASGTTSCG